MTANIGLRQGNLPHATDGKRYAVVSDAQMSCPEFLIDMIADIRIEVWDIPDRNCSDHFMNIIRDLRGTFISPDGSEYVFSESLVEERRDCWRRSIKTDEPRTSPLRLRVENQEFFREAGSALAAQYPEKAALWGVR